MTIIQLIEKVKEEKPNTFTDAKLITFINEIETDVATELRYESADIPQYEDTEADKAKELLVHAPYDRLYVSYLKAMIDYANEEYASYQNNAAQHVQDFSDFSNWVVRTKQEAQEPILPRRFRHAM